MAVLGRLWALRRERCGFVALTGLVLIALAAFPLVDQIWIGAELSTEFRYYDFGAYRNAVLDWRTGDPIYEPNDDGGFHGNYLYPPVFLPLFAGFMRGFEAPGAAWGIFSLLALWVSLQLAAREFRLSLHPLERPLLLWLLFGFQPILFGFKMGQVSTFLSALVTLALVAIVRDLRGGGPLVGVASGVFTALGSGVKLIYAPTGAHLLRSRRRLGGAMVAVLALAGLSMLLFDPATHRGYLDVLLWGKDWGVGSRSPHLWTAAYFRPFLAIEPIALVVRGALVIATIALALGADGPEAELPTFALGVAIVPLAAPRAYTFDLVVLLPAVVVLLALELERDGRPWIPVVGLLLLHLHAYGLRAFVAVSELSPGAFRPLLPLLQPGMWGSVLIAGLAFHRVRAHADLRGRLERITPFNIPPV